ncbi:MAG: hypothetical protein JW967_05675 [Dehalococcoidales bacterium]|nr:hypothetical protein [Dehalococcoidales bacterium]
MAKLPMRCPFSGKMCKECSYFRGRHYYLCNDKSYRGHINMKENAETKKTEIKTENKPQDFNFNTIIKLCEPWSGSTNTQKYIPKIKLKVIYREDGTNRIYEPEEAKTWEWDNPKIIRTFSNVQVNSFGKLIEMIRYQEAQGAKEAVIFEAPWFLLT